MTADPNVRPGRPRDAKPGDIFPDLYDPAWLGDPGQECPCCGHGAAAHDIETLDDPRPSCCVTVMEQGVGNALGRSTDCPCGPRLAT
jgi:hypothetical protein